MFGAVCFWIFSRFTIFNYFTTKPVRIAVFLNDFLREKEADRIKAQLVKPESELDTVKMRFTPKIESGNDVLMCSNLSCLIQKHQLNL